MEQPLRNAFTQITVLSAICYISCQQTGPGLVRQVSQIQPHAFHIGVYSHIVNGTKSDTSKVQDLISFDGRSQEVQDINTERWIKMVLNESWNQIAALTRYDSHRLLRKPLGGLSLAIVRGDIRGGGEKRCQSTTRLAAENTEFRRECRVDCPFNASRCS